MRDLYVGFDSAWTDNQKRPGALCALAIEAGRITRFHPPELTTFGQAIDRIERLARDADYLLVALDQPTLVPNHDSCRPVDRVAGSLVNRIGGGVQPANRSKSQMFGDDAPVWPFLQRLNARENPWAARAATSGRFLIEVFPALALPSMIEAIWDRRRAAKYNPGSRKMFSMEDWTLVTAGVAAFTGRLGVPQVTETAFRYQAIPEPTKSDQDRLDSLICLVVALAWRMDRPEHSAVIGDGRSGYMVTPVSPETRCVLALKARECDVSIDVEWSSDASRTVALPNVHRPAAPEVTKRSAVSVPSPKRLPTVKAPADVVKRNEARGKAVVDDQALRSFLVSAARSGQTVTYGEVAAYFGHPWTQGFGASLNSALDKLGELNKAAGEPLLMALVVNASEGLPGIGYHRSARTDHLPRAAQRERHREELQAIRTYAWSG